MCPSPTCTSRCSISSACIRNRSATVLEGWMRKFSRSSVLVLLVGCTLGAVLSAAASDPRLIRAIRGKELQTVRTLIKERVDVNATQGDGSTPLHWAARVDDVTIVDA